MHDDVREVRQTPLDLSIYPNERILKRLLPSTRHLNGNTLWNDEIGNRLPNSVS